MNSLLIPIISAVVSAVISYFVTITLKNKDYKNEYYKKVIDKRIAAYEKLEIVAQSLHYLIKVDDIEMHAIFKDIESLGKFREELNTAFNSTMWLSDNAEYCLYAILGIIRGQMRKWDINEISQLHTAGAEVFSNISETTRQLKECLRHDIYHLHDVKQFFESRN